jgi:hypothetical protein
MPISVGTVRDIPVRALELCGLTWSGEFLWFSESVSNEIKALDPITGQVEHRVPCPEVRTDLTTMSGNLVQIVGERRALQVIDPGSGDVVDEIPNPRPGTVLCGLEAARDGVWFGYEDLRVLDLRASDDGRLVDSIPVRHPIAGLTVSDHYLAYADHGGGTINLVDIDRRREVASYRVAGNPTGLTWDGSRIWYCDHTNLQLRAIEVPGIGGAA